MNKNSQENTINDSCVDTAFNKERILNLLEILNISTTGRINVIEELNHTPTNKSIVIEIPNDGCVGENQILLNVKQGQPAVGQIFDAVYQKGSDCHQRIIAFTGGNFLDDKFNPSADVDTVKCLVDTVNRFDLNIHLVKMIYDSTSSNCDYEILAQPDSHPEFSRAECPSKEKFTEAEFWEVYFWGYDNWVEATPFEDGFDSNNEYSQCFPIGDLEIETKWTSEGAIIRIKDTGDNKYVLGDMWNDRKDEIQDMFRGSEIELLIRSGAVLKLIVKVFDKPIGDLAGMPWREKMHYAGLLWSKFIQIQEFMEKALQDLKYNGSINEK